MSDTARLAALRRLRKCLRLAASATEPGEVAAALHQARNLMRVHGLTEDDAEFADIREVTTRASGGTSIAHWELVLIDCVRHAFGVAALFRSGAAGKPHFVYGKRSTRPTLRLSRKRGDLIFVGPAGRVEVAFYGFETLRRQLKQARKDHAAANKRRGRALDAFALGWVNGVRAKLEALAASFGVDPATQAYVDEQATKDKELSVRSGKPRNYSELFAYRDGKAAAADAVLNAGVNGAAGGFPLPAPPKALPGPL